MNPQLPSINIFMIGQKSDSESPLARALRENKKEKSEQHEQTISKLSAMIRELQTLPRSEHAGGG